jgi:predicted peptidase
MKHGVLLIMFFVTVAAMAQNKAQYQKWWFIQNGDTMPYRLLLPKDYDASKEYPLLVFLHGRGESGNDNNRQLANGASVFLRDSIRNKHAAIILFPQCSGDSYWSNVVTIKDSTGKRQFHFITDGEPSRAMKQLLSLLQFVRSNYKVDDDRVYTMGLSMGGMGTYELVRRKPKTFAAGIAICGGADPATAKQIRHTSWWLFHGLKDDIVDPSFTKTMEAALKKKRAKVKATYYPNANHNSWDAAFAEPGLLDWLFAQRKR